MNSKQIGFGFLEVKSIGEIIEEIGAFDLSAFHVSHFLISMNGSEIGLNFDLEDGKLVFNPHTDLDLSANIEKPLVSITFFYYDVVFEKLFLGIKNDQLREAMRAYYLEADRAIKSECWLSFGLLVGSLIESYLLEVLGRDRGSLSSLINEAYSKRKIFDDELKSFNEIREFRNYIHPNNFASIDRDKAFKALQDLENLVFLVHDHSSLRSSLSNV